MKNLSVISDPGIDDLVALILLYKLETKINNTCLISTFGNAPEDITAKNAKELISFVSTKWQFMHGTSKPLNDKFEHPWPDYFHGHDGVWGIHPEVDTSKIKTITKYPKNENVISLATLTDVYKLNKTTGIKNITIMGGAFTVEGNETKYAETNIAFDPDSAHNFFNQFSNINTKIVPLDVTRKVFWTFDQVNSIPESNKINKWIKKLLLTWFNKYNHNREKDFNLHDPLAVYLAYFPDKAKWHSSGVKIITKGIKRGQSIFSKDNYPCQIAVDLNNPDIISKNIYSLVFE
ncbi:MAG: nucleoside hydrolase [Nanoarchaeota archaeon]